MARPIPRLPPVTMAMRLVLEVVMDSIVGPDRAQDQPSVHPGTACPWLHAGNRRSVSAMDRDGVADFLRRRREALQPGDVGLPATRRRRTGGLRREEVASLAHMSADFYTRLEQRRGARPSEQTVAALALALRLTDDERDHLLRLAGHQPRPRGARTDHVSPALLRVLDRLDAPAQVVSDLGVTLKQNPLAEALLGVQTTYTGLARSQIYRWFLMPEERRRFLTDDHEMHARSYTAHLRAALGRTPDDDEARSLLDALHRDSPEFTELWNDTTSASEPICRNVSCTRTSAFSPSTVRSSRQRTNCRTSSSSRRRPAARCQNLRSCRFCRRPEPTTAELPPSEGCPRVNDAGSGARSAAPIDHHSAISATRRQSDDRRRTQQLRSSRKPDLAHSRAERMPLIKIRRAILATNPEGPLS